MEIKTYYDDLLLEYVAYNADNYCGCGDCADPLGRGRTKEEAVNDLKEALNEEI